MFDGTDLSVAYGTPSSAFDQQPSMMSPVGPQSTPVQPPPVQREEVQQPSVQMPPTQPPDIQYNPPPSMFMQQTSYPQQMQPMQVLPPNDDTLWDRISQKKLDVLKLFVLALVVLLGISMDKLATHYVTSYINGSILSDIQEFLVRLSYPAIVLIVLWLIKASV